MTSTIDSEKGESKSRARQRVMGGGWWVVGVFTTTYDPRPTTDHLEETRVRTAI